MIEYHYETDFCLADSNKFTYWLTRAIEDANAEFTQIDFVFCNDEYLHDINFKYLGHNTYTDIITFDYTNGNIIAGDVFISVERLKENSEKFQVGFEEELLRVMAHGVLHLLGYNDKTGNEKASMRTKENEMIKMFHVEH